MSQSKMNEIEIQARIAKCVNRRSGLLPDGCVLGIKPESYKCCRGEYEEPCGSYSPRTREQVDQELAEEERHLDCLRRGVSPCCEAPYNESQVITRGRHKGHGPRFCSQCGKLVFRV